MGVVGVSSISSAPSARQKAARMAAFTDIRDVRLLRTQAEIVNLPGDSPFLAYTLDFDAVVEHEPGSESFVVRGTYRVSVSSTTTLDGKSAPSEEDPPIANFEFEHAALFVMDIADREPPASEELNAFAVTTGQFALHPYVREYISDLTMRLGLPPLTIGILRVGLPAGEGLK
jgi:Preprotein translocase subunit SecB